MNVTENSKVRNKVRSTDTTIQQPAHMPSGNTTALRTYRRAFWVSHYFQKSCFPTMAYCIFCDMSQFTTPPPHPLSGAQIRSITDASPSLQRLLKIDCRHGVSLGCTKGAKQGPNTWHTLRRGHTNDETHRTINTVLSVARTNMVPTTVALR